MKSEDKPDRYDLLENESIRSIFKNRKTQFYFQLPAVLLLVLVVFAGFFGIQNSNKNLATISIWVIWWSLLIISLALAGRIWCLMCPFGAIGDWVQRHTFYKKVNETFSLNRKWPVKFRNLSLASVFFLVITWADFQFNLVNSPLYTAYFIVALLGLIVIISIIFERRSFCRYACPITGLIGLYSMFAPLELRAKEKDTCKTCKEKYCISGNENGYACPVFEYPGTMDKNTVCVLCTECVKTCHRNNISFNIRSFAGDFLTATKTRMDEALFILVLLGVTIFQTLIMIRPWAGFTRDLMVYTGASYDSVRFILFITAAAFPVLIYSIAIAISKLFNQKIISKDLITGYAYSIIPLGLMMHLSHNIRHLLEEGTGIIPVLSDPFGFGWNLFGTSGYMPVPLLGSNNILLIQWLLMLIGLGFSISIGKNISRRVFRGNDYAYIPVLIFVLIFFVFNLWVLGQPIMHKH
ncbi:MAG: 4Fe-4S binding protein [Euryarchaeota archaeon]|nr:4Fe-4S binding protein [Euryarchaeota archaeon]MCG2737436.1 4Fe-4S binding protein [Candidatus Methanoperedenaceae archaeon]